MKKHKLIARLRWTALAALSLAGCWDSDPCDQGQVFKDGVCYQATSGSAGSSATGGQANSSAGAGGDASPASDNFGSPCEQPSDCVGNSPICAPAPLGYCTNINCATGEANADVCPASWTCFPASNGNPSACVKL